MSIKKIAEATGYSMSTVSRVLNKPDYKCASDEIRDKILKAAREQGYVPNESARNLKFGRTDNSSIFYISIIVTYPEYSNSDPFFNEVQRVVEREVRKNHCMLSNIWRRPVFFTDEKCRILGANTLVKELFVDCGNKTDGIIIIGRCSPLIIKELSKYCKNIVSITRTSVNYQVDEVICDSIRIAEMSVNYLYDLGHRKIGYVGGKFSSSKFNGYVQTLLSHKIALNHEYIYEIKLGEEYGYKVMEEIMSKEDIPTAIYCVNDLIAIGMLNCLKKYRNRSFVPSIISNDDIEEAQYTTPMLTTIRLPKEEMAMFALEILINRIRGFHKTIVKMQLDAALVVRGSCTNINAMEGCEYFI